MRSRDPFKIKYKYELPVETNAVMFVLNPCKVLTTNLWSCVLNFPELLPPPTSANPPPVSLSLGELSTMHCDIKMYVTFSVTVFQTRRV